MRSSLPLLALAAGTAAAQPVTHPETDASERCRVTIAVAPDDVRAEIEAWVAAEPRCERELEVRVVPSEDGLYLQAREARTGRVRERVVPDSQSAAVLVVSWMADDSIGPTLPVVSPPREPVVDDIEQPPELSTGLVVHATHGRKAERLLAFGALGSRDDRGGIRAQIDLYSWRRWRFGVAAGTRREAGGHARLVLGRSAQLGPIGLRAQVGIGVESDPDARDRMDSADTMERHRVGPSIETAVFARVPIAGRWGVIGGPLVENSRSREHPTMSMFLGVQHGL